MVRGDETERFLTAYNDLDDVLRARIAGGDRKISHANLIDRGTPLSVRSHRDPGDGAADAPLRGLNTAHDLPSVNPNASESMLDRLVRPAR